MDGSGFTPFPDLASSSITGNSPHAQCEFEAYRGLEASKDAVIRSWSRLLRAYTSDDDVVIMVDGQPTVVPSADDNPTRCVEANHQPGSISSGVLFDSSPENNATSEASVMLHHSLQSGIGRVVSSSVLPKIQVLQIALQLKAIVADSSGTATKAEEADSSTQLELSILNPRPEPAAGSTLLHELLQRHKDSSRPAVFHLDSRERVTSLSYQSLHERSSKLAAALLRDPRLQLQSSSQASIIPVLMPQGPELYVALLAVLKAGAAFCPLNLDAPAERIKFVAHDTGAKIILTTTSQKHQIPAGLSDLVLCSDSLEQNSAQDPRPYQPPDVHALCYVLYTSGSTGQPKGVALSHSAVVQSLCAHDPHIPPYNRFLQFAAPTFDVSMFEIFFTLLRGSAIASCDRQKLLADLPGTMNVLEVDAAELTPTVAGSLLKRRDHVPGLKVLLTIGEMLSANVVEEFGDSAARPGILYAMYGPTEAAIHCTLQPKILADSKVGNIGRPLHTVSTFVLSPSPSGEILPVGQIGELALGGHQLAVGYLNRPDQTQSAFISHPVYGRLYRTGDKARQLPDGSLECLGRIASGQVKLRGQRIELGEIESSALRTEGITNSVASIIDEQLILFCLRGSQSVAEQTVLETCKKWLPGFMVPNNIILVSEWPQLPSGKVDRKSLETSYADSTTSQNDDAPTSSLEKQVFDAVEQVLGKPLGMQAQLSRAGLDSLQSIRLASTLRDIGLHISAIDILRAGSMRAISELQRESEAAVPDPWFSNASVAARERFLHESQASPTEVDDVYPCSPLQSSMLAETGKYPAAYWNSIGLEVENLTFEALEHLFQELSEHNPILRTGFASTDDPEVPYIQVVWRSLHPGQLRLAGSNQSSERDLLYPLRVTVRQAGSVWHVAIEIHHAQYDGWSWDLLLADLSSLIRKEKLSQRPSFKKFSEYAHSFLRSPSCNKSRAFWESNLADFDPVGFPNLSGKQDPRQGSQVLSHLSTVPVDRLLGAVQKLGVHPQSLFHGALSILLGQYLGCTDLAIGTVVSGRTAPVPGIEQVVGPCISTVPLRIDLAPISTITELLATLHARARDLLSHSLLPLSEIKRAANCEPGSPIFDVLVVWQQSLQDVDNYLDGHVRQTTSRDFLETKLLIELETKQENVQIRATYQNGFIPEQQMRLMLSQLDDLAGQLADAISSESDRQINDVWGTQALSTFNTSPTKIEAAGNLACHVEYWAEKDPERLAVTVATTIEELRFETQDRTFADLNSSANRIAHDLVDNGVQPDDLVIVAAEKSFELYAAILAVVKAGAAFAGVAPDTPKERVSLILGQITSQVVLTSNSMKDAVTASHGVKVLEIEQIISQSSRSDNLHIPFKPDNLAFAIFTSGTTGTPKGVLVTQQNLTSNIEALTRWYPQPSTKSRMLQACSQTFDMFVFEVFWSWRHGMCICTAPKDLIYRDLERTIQAFHITHLDMTPTVASLVRPEKVPTVEALQTAGEPMNPTVWRNWAGKGLLEGYGPSETTIINTLTPTSLENVPNYLGQVFENSSAFVIAEGVSDFKLLPRGAVGEFCFGGDQTFRGYLNQDDLNKEKICNHPEFGKIYRSGDLGRMLHDGSLLITGRADDQVKIRGNRVELGEISSSILADSAVDSCATYVFKNEATTQQELVAFWVSKDQASRSFRVLDLDDKISKSTVGIFDKLRDRLPSYMVPDILIPVSSLPQTSQSKIDKRLLQSTYKDLDARFRARVSSGSDELSGEENTKWSLMESNIAESLAKTCSISTEEIGRNVSFFSYGIDSISAIAFARSVRSVVSGVDVDVSTIMKNKTISRLAAALDAPGELHRSSMPVRLHLQDFYSADAVSQLERDHPNAKIQPCTPLQEAMLLGDSAGEPTGYYNQTLFRVTGNLGRMRECWQSMVDRHDILRTFFVSSSDRERPFAQVVCREASLDWTEHEVDTFTTEQLMTDASKTTKSALASKDPPFSVKVFSSRQSPDRLMLLSMHHALYDGVALTELYTEIELSFNEQPLPQPVSSELFLARALTLNQNESDEFWRHAFEGFNPTPLPDLTGKSAAARKALTGSSLTSFTFDTPLNSVENACRKNETNLLSVCQAAWAKVLFHVLGELDVCFGNVVSGRTLPVDGIERLVAPCFNTLPVRATLGNSASNDHLVSSLQEYNADCLPFQMTPLRRLQAILGDGSGTRLFDTLFILQQHSRRLDPSIWEIVEDHGEMDFPIVCEVCPNTDDDTLEVSFHCKQSVLSSEDTPVLFHIMESALRSCLFSPAASALGLTNLEEKYLAISNPQTTENLGQENALLHSSFEKNVQDRPNAPAIDFLQDTGERTILTFAELDTAAERVACALRRESIEVDEAVPIHLPKSPSYYASVLGVLKAGAAFTPFDPSTPSERKKFMIDELGARLLLSDKDIDNTWTETSILNVSELPNSNDKSGRSPSLVSSSLAYRLYTSGSTGRPKAVSVEHRNAVQTIAASRSSIRWSLKSRLLQFASITFDMCYYDCFMAWSYGFCLCAAPQMKMFNDLQEIIKQLDVNMLDLTPSVASSLKRQSVPSIDYLYCIGEAMPQSLVEAWAGACVNSYGPTEAAMCVTIFPVDKNVKSTIIGHPFDTTSFYVVGTSSGETVPVFGVGELYLGGSQIARGYHANEKLTATQFVESGKERLYKTGDLVRKLANGEYEFLGRADDQVKIRGLRVELGEVNSILKSSNEEVKDVSTQVMASASSSKEQLVSFIALARGVPADSSAVRKRLLQALSQQLPAYMVPTATLFLDKIPLSPAGKADRKALYKIFQDSHEGLADEPPAQDAEQLSSTQHAVRQVLANLSSLSPERIGPTTTIFQLGFDSISAVQIASELKKKGFQTNAGNIVGRPTLEGIAATINPETDLSNAVDNERPHFDFVSFDHAQRQNICERHGLSPLHVAHIRPCSSLQSAMLTQFVNSDGKEYFNQVTLKLPDKYNEDILREAWDCVIERHELLRSGFSATDDSNHPMAIVTLRARKARVPFEATSSATSTSEWHARTAQKVRANLQEPAWAVLLQATSNAKTMSISMHHALFDATTMNIILSDLSQACQGDATFPISQPIEPVLERMIQPDPALERRAEAFWAEAGKSALINPFPNLHPFLVTDTGFQVLEQKSSSTFSSLQGACQAQNATVQAAGQAAWAKVLAAYTGESIVTFGTVFSGRIDEEAELVSFPCINTMPIVAETAQSGSGLLQSLMQHNAAIHEHQHIPLARIQRWMGMSEIGSFDTLFAYQKKAESHTSGDWEIVDEQATAEYPISIELEPTKDDKLVYRITYRKDRVPSQQADLILRQLDHALNNVLFGTQQPQVNDLVDAGLYSVSPAKHEMLPSDSNLLHEFVEHGATKHPSAVAFEFYSAIDESGGRKRSWSYDELNKEGNRVAHYLRRHKVEQGSIVAVCFDKCPEASFAMLGILKAGCGFLALDPGAPAARKKFIAEDSKATAVMTMKQQSGSFAEVSHCPVIVMDAESFEDMPCSSPALDRPVQPFDTSYCLYTSGTTGTPKGCDLSHENAVQALLAFQHIFKWTPKARWLQFASFHFDVSVLEQYWTWSVGVCMVSAPRDLILEDLPGAIRNLGITHIDLTPSLARLVDPEDVPSLCSPTSVFITGGEALKQEIIGKWGQFETIYNGYGPTEATIGCTMFPRVPTNGKPANIGSQFLNVGSFVLNPGTSEPVLRGAQGELCVSGPLVAKGYLNRPDLTAERFPVIEVGGIKSRIYRTGDLVRVLHDGTFAFLGRADDQVKLRGQRLEIGEINAVEKESTEDVQDVSTLVLKHPKQQREQLVSFLTSETHFDSKSQPEVLLESSSSTVATAREACQSKLPGYMVPTHFILMNRLPLSANNKVDAKQLKAIYEDLDAESLQKLSDSSTSSDKDWSAAERGLAEVIARHLSIDASEISKSTSVFELGLDSISAIGLTRALKESGYGNVHTSTVMKNSTVGRLAKALKRAQEDAQPQDDATVKSAKQSITAFGHRYRTEVAKGLNIKPSEIEYVAPCTPLQQGIISRALESEKPVYFAQFLFELYPETNLQKLKSACEEVVRTTPILRTAFCSTNDGHAQVAITSGHLSWDGIKMPQDSDLDHVVDEAHREWWLRNREQIREPLQITIVSSPAKTVMALHIFHALYDGTSLPLIMDLVLAKYHETAFSDAPAFYEVLPYGPLRSVDGAHEFWLDHLRHAPAKAFSKLEPLVSDPAPEDSLSTSEFTDMHAFEKCRRSLNVTQQALVQACWAAVLQSSFGGPVNIGMVVSGRSVDYTGADRTIGPLFNTIPFHLGLRKDQSWKEAVEACHAFNTAALPYQHTPLRDMKKWCRQLPHFKNRELFENLFVFQRAETAASETGRNPIWKPMDGNFEADYPLAFEAEQSADGTLNLTIVSQAHVSSSKTSADLLDKVKEALTALIADPGAHIGKTLNIQTVDAAPTASSNGHTKNKSDHANGATTHDFSWDEHSLRIRAEVAGLSDLPPEEVDAHTSILELGLDSIDAIKLSSRLKRSAELQIPVSQIMQSLTIARLAEATSHEGQNGKGASQEQLVDLDAEERNLRSYLEESDINNTTVQRVLPVAPLQEAMLAQMLASDWSEYFNHDILELGADTDVEALKAAWQRVVDSNQILRSSFVSIDDPKHGSSFAQVVHAEHELQWHELRASVDESESLFEGIRKDMSSATGGNIPFRLTLLCASGQDKPTHLIISIAHALYDGWSLGLMHQDVATIYNGGSISRPPIDPLLTDILATARDEAAAEYWRDTLSGLTPALLSEDDADTPQSVFRKEHHSATSASAAQQFCKANGTTLAALCQTAYALLLMTLTRKLDVAFGTVTSGRDSEDASEVMFPAMNTVAFRAVAHGTRVEMAQYVQAAMGAMKPFERFPLRRAMALVRGSALFDSLFVFQRRPDSSNAAVTKELYWSVSGASDIEYPLAVEVEQVGEALTWRDACKSGVFSEDQAEQLLRDVDDILACIIRDPSAATLAFEDDEKVSVCGTAPFREAQADANARPEDVAPSDSPLETPIRQVLAQVAQVPEDELSATTTLFNLGLDSISAIKVSSLLRKQGIRLSVSAMLKAGTTARMAEAAEGESTASPTTAVDTHGAISHALKDVDVPAVLRTHAISEAAVAAVLPATAGQTYMLSMHQNHDLFFPTFKYDVRGSTTPARLRRAWAQLVRETPVLRSLLLATGRADVPFVQAVLQPDEAEANGNEEDDEDDCSGEVEPATPFARLALRDHRPFGIGLTLHIHHALYDGVSLALLADRLATLCDDPTAPTGDDALPFEAFVAHTLDEKSRAEQRAFWESYMAGLSPSASPAPPSLSGPTQRIEVYSPAMTPAPPLQALAAAHNLPLQALVLAAYARVFATLTAQEPGSDSGSDMLLGAYLANRTPETARTPGPTLALVPLRLQDPLRDALSVAADVAAALRDVRPDVSLAHIPGAAGVRTWVNFLALPSGDESESSDDALAGRSEGVAIVSAPDDDARTGYARVTSTNSGNVDAQERGAAVRRLCDANAVRGAYGPALDVEVAVRGGQVDVGMFCPEGFSGLDLEGVRGLVRQLGELLCDIGSGS